MIMTNNQFIDDARRLARWAKAHIRADHERDLYNEEAAGESDEYIKEYTQAMGICDRILAPAPAYTPEQVEGLVDKSENVLIECSEIMRGEFGSDWSDHFGIMFRYIEELKSALAPFTDAGIIDSKGQAK